MNGWDEFAAAALEGRPLPLEVIDIHAHIGDYAAFWAPGRDARAMVEVMNEIGVAVAAISANSAWSAEAKIGNDLVARAVRAYPGRFVGYAVANPNYPEDIEDELRRSFDELGFRMIKIHPSVHRCSLTDERYEEVFVFAARHNAPILTHTWDKDPLCSPEVAAEAAKRHPGVTFLWGHSGGGDVRAAVELAVGLPNVYLELAASNVVDGRLEYMTSHAPVTKIVFGSDFSFISLPQQVAKVAFARISPAAKRRILHHNAARIFVSAGIGVR